MNDDANHPFLKQLPDRPSILVLTPTLVGWSRETLAAMKTYHETRLAVYCEEHGLPTPLVLFAMDGETISEPVDITSVMTPNEARSLFGLDPLARLGPSCPVGVSVRFLGTGGYPSQRQEARECLDTDKSYRVVDKEVNSFSTYLTLSDPDSGEVLGSFNSVMFEVAG